MDDIADKIGMAACVAERPDKIEFIMTDKVDQMVLLYAILSELRKITDLLSSEKTQLSGEELNDSLRDLLEKAPKQELSEAPIG